MGGRMVPTIARALSSYGDYAATVFLATPFDRVVLPRLTPSAPRALNTTLRLFSELPGPVREMIARKMYERTVRYKVGITEAMVSAARDLEPSSSAALLYELINTEVVFRDLRELGQGTRRGLVIHGRRDPIANPAPALRWAHAMAWEVGLLEDVGHSPATERPDLVADLMIGFLSGSGANDIQGGGGE